MKKLLAFTIAALFVLPAIAANQPAAPQDATPKITQPVPQPNGNETCDPIARRGCCSHHNGVCGCRNGRTTCCDGSTSPSCTCYGREMES